MCYDRAANGQQVHNNETISTASTDGRPGNAAKRATSSAAEKASFAGQAALAHQ
jgi:hypothetical protein